MSIHHTDWTVLEFQIDRLRPVSSAKISASLFLYVIKICTFYNLGTVNAATAHQYPALINGVLVSTLSVKSGLIDAWDFGELVALWYLWSETSWCYSLTPMWELLGAIGFLS